MKVWPTETENLWDLIMITRCYATKYGFHNSLTGILLKQRYIVHLWSETKEFYMRKKKRNLLRIILCLYTIEKISKINHFKDIPITVARFLKGQLLIKFISWAHVQLIKFYHLVTAQTSCLKVPKALQ